MDSKTSAETLVVSAGRMTGDHFGAVNTPVYRTSTILFADAGALSSEDVPYTYGRNGTPSSRSFEAAMEALEGAARVLSLPSGLAAISVAILAVAGSGDHILMTDNVYWPTRHLCDGFFRRMGIETTFFDPRIGGGIAALFKPNTKAVYCESPGSLTFEITDIPAIAAAAHARSVAVLMDNTWATPLYFDAFRHGVDLTIHAATKYIGGHSDLMMGTVGATAAYANRLLATVHDLGLCASGDDCFLALRGMRTLAVRLARHQETALTLAKWLAGRPEVARVLHPALPDDPGHNLWRRDFTGASGLFGVVLRDAPAEAVTALIEGRKHFGIGYSWGGYESLVIPARLTRTACAFVGEGPVIRIHAGLENADDLIADLETGLAAFSRVITRGVTTRTARRGRLKA
jgi:cysteine-S-conjugate beta-lyase